MSNRLLLLLVGLLAAAVALAATNPGTIQYGQFLETVLAQALQRMDSPEGSSQQRVMGEILASQGKKLIESLVRSNTIRRDYGLFSVFTTRVFQVEVIVVGVGTRFIPLESRDELVKKLGKVML